MQWGRGGGGGEGRAYWPFTRPEAAACAFSRSPISAGIDPVKYGSTPQLQAPAMNMKSALTASPMWPVYWNKAMNRVLPNKARVTPYMALPWRNLKEKKVTNKTNESFWSVKRRGYTWKVDVSLGNVHTTPGKSENVVENPHCNGENLKRNYHQENSDREIRLSWFHCFRKASFSKWFPSTLRRKASVFKFLRFEERFRKVPFFVWISVEGML